MYDTRKPKASKMNYSEMHKGQRAHDESYIRLLWIAEYHPNEFYRNL